MQPRTEECMHCGRRPRILLTGPPGGPMAGYQIWLCDDHTETTRKLLKKSGWIFEEAGEETS